MKRDTKENGDARLCSLSGVSAFKLHYPMSVFGMFIYLLYLVYYLL